MAGLLAGWWNRWLGRRLNGKGSGRAIEDPITPMIGGDAAAALQCGAVWACCRLLSESISALPGHIFEVTETGKEKARKHPYYRLLTVQPNPLMSLVQWLQTTVLHLMLYGNAYTLPEMVDGEVVALWPIQPDQIRVAQDESGQYFYRLQSGGQPLNISPLQILHFRVFSLDGIYGLSPIEYQRAMFQMDAVTRTYSYNLYANGGRPAGVLEYAGNLTKDQIAEIRAAWKQIHSGAGNAGSVVVLEGGTKYSALAVPPDQLEFISQQKFSVEQIARIYGVPPHLIGAMDKPTYASVEQQALEFVQYTLQPIITSMERTIQTVLLEDPYLYKFNLAGFERGDIKTRYAAYAVGRQWGFLSVNDIRELEDMNRIGADGDVYLQPLNMVPAGQEANDGESTGVQGVPSTGM